MCSPGYRVSDWREYLSDWSTTSLNKGDTLDNRKECWDLAKQNVPSAIGIYFDYTSPYCRAMDDASSLMPWPTSFANDQDSSSLCILSSHIQDSGNFKYNIIIF